MRDANRESRARLKVMTLKLTTSIEWSESPEIDFQVTRLEFDCSKPVSKSSFGFIASRALLISGQTRLKYALSSLGVK